jgi:hypothetical protein
MQLLILDTISLVHDLLVDHNHLRISPKFRLPNPGNVSGKNPEKNWMNNSLPPTNGSHRDQKVRKNTPYNDIYLFCFSGMEKKETVAVGTLILTRMNHQR